mmetsp:Transcript_140258/g.244287  ORF Transcript_140258/g.244287 Transcript_140258/m.244287 type:complete len:248 (-) Transcript_140258:293-1036(-)
MYWKTRHSLRCGCRSPTCSLASISHLPTATMSKGPSAHCHSPTTIIHGTTVPTHCSRFKTHAICWRHCIRIDPSVHVLVFHAQVVCVLRSYSILGSATITPVATSALGVAVVVLDCCQRTWGDVLHLGLQRIYNPESFPLVDLPHDLSLSDQSSHLSVIWRRLARLFQLFMGTENALQPSSQIDDSGWLFLGTLYLRVCQHSGQLPVDYGIWIRRFQNVGYARGPSGVRGTMATILKMPHLAMRRGI